MSVMLSAVGNRSYSASSGNVYVADQFGVISNVSTADDINDLEAAGCVLLSAGGTQTKWVLSATQQYYVRTDGSDSNDGITNTAGGAWLTLQYAYDWICQNVDQNGYSVFINCAAGTYVGILAITIVNLTGPINIVGNPADYTDVTIIDGDDTPISFYNTGSVNSIFVMDLILYSATSQCFSTSQATSLSLGQDSLGNFGAIGLKNDGGFIVGYCYGSKLQLYGDVHFDLDAVTFSSIFYLEFASVLSASPNDITHTGASMDFDNFLAMDLESTGFYSGNAPTGTYNGRRFTITNGSHLSYPPVNSGNIPGNAIGRRDFKIKLYEDKTYYVRSDGSDLNSGEVDSQDGAWLTVQHAYDWIADNVDQSGFVATISIVIDGDYVGLASYTKKCYSGPVIIEGNPSLPYAVRLTDTGFGVINMQAPGPTASLFLRNLRIHGNDVASPGVLAWYDNYIGVGASPSVFSGYDMKFTGLMSELVQAGFGGSLEWYSNAIVDMATIPWLFTSISRAYLWVFLNTLNFAQALAVANESVNASELTYAAYRRGSQTGSAVTAKRYSVTGNSLFLQTNVPPGATAGTTGTGGQVI